jgi:hypothetical protein
MNSASYEKNTSTKHNKYVVNQKLEHVEASYIDLHLEIDSRGRLRRKLYDKRDDFNVPIVNFPFICSNFSAAPTYGVYISQMMRYSVMVTTVKLSK